ncbi:MAG: hypothetical protein Unbinned1819contig1001_8 [Prokaryotic dsDNA virus sp.]|nr:MAG: hypothetical protein Unbinned1819contig1001_8 [Prokaryotic dsDNA virus sp.]|tara:strand:+ start:4561 stop:5121 length:561 start_codon:yes stop_codon:yes gene_type:complete
MAVTIDATAGGASANSYLTLADANTLVEAMISSTDVGQWLVGTDDTRNRALTAAAQRLDRERFIGAKATDTQAMQWPRTGVRKPDTYVNTYATGFPFRISEDYFTDTELPDQIKRAQVELAVYLKNNTDGISLGGLEDFKSIQIGSINLTPDKSGAIGADRVPPMFERYLTGIRISGPGNIAIRRS